jgi:sugar (pentulose or hexulose) kinase
MKLSGPRSFLNFISVVQAFESAMRDLALGIDVGTSAVRAAAVDANGCRAAFASARMPAPFDDNGLVTQRPTAWWKATRRVLQNLARQIDLKRIGAIAVDGTSGTVLGVDANGQPVAPAQMYNSRGPVDLVRSIAGVAPPESAARGATSALARAIVMQTQRGVARSIQQADWISGQFSGRFDVTDENNALKLGYDPVARCWPDWLVKVGVRPDHLSTVLPTGTIARHRASALGLAADVVIVAGTTDGCASFLAAGAERCGDAVTSLGTTLVLKLLSDRPLFDSNLGVYSHRIDDLWLVGGASNSGGAAIAKHFSLDRICELSEKMSPNVPTGLHYYPLAGHGERFPQNNPDMQECVEPRPESDLLFLQALMEGVTRVEKLGYDCLAKLGGPWVNLIRTVGGGAKNAAWRAIRARMLGIPIVDPVDDEPAVGAAKLARRGLFLVS